MGRVRGFEVLFPCWLNSKAFLVNGVGLSRCLLSERLSTSAKCLAVLVRATAVAKGSCFFAALRRYFSALSVSILTEIENAIS